MENGLDLREGSVPPVTVCKLNVEKPLCIIMTTKLYSNYIQIFLVNTDPHLHTVSTKSSYGT